MLRPALHGAISILIIATLIGCSSSIGNNKSYLLKYKKNLAEWYDREIEEHAKDEAKKCQRILEANTYLPFMYDNNMPFVLTNHYDSRGPSDSKIWKGDPISIIINKVYLANNKEAFSQLGDTGEIGVVVSIEDGKGNEPKNVLVSYEEGIKDKIYLPISDLLAYHTEAYNDEPIQIKVTVFEFDQLENENLKKILGTAAQIGSALTPAYAPAISAAAQVGDFLIKQNQDDVIAKFTFQLYPWDLASASGRITKSIGVPRVTYGHYLIVNAEGAEDGNTTDDFSRKVFADFGLTAYTVVPTSTAKVARDTPQSSYCGDGPVITNGKTNPWPVSPEPKVTQMPLGSSYLVLTVSKTQSQNANAIIGRINTINRTASGLSNIDTLDTARALALGQQLDDLRSSLIAFTELDQFDQRKEDPSALKRLFDTLETPTVGDTDKVTLSRRIADLLPPMTNEFKSSKGVSEDKLKNKDTLVKWYEEIKGRLVFDRSKGTYMCKEEGKQDCSK